MKMAFGARWLSCVGLFMALAGFVAGCSVAMEASRPAPVRLAQFKNGESRDDVTAKLGEPTTTTTDADGASCDLYTLPLSGYNNWAKAGIAFGEVLADFATIGIAEVATTPTEAATRNRKTPVWFCYKNNVLVRVTPKRLEAEDLASSERVSTAAATPAASPNHSQSAPATAPAPSAPQSTGTAAASPNLPE